MICEITEARAQAFKEAAQLCRNLANMLPDDGARDERGWPTSIEGAARHQSLAIASAMQDMAAMEGIERRDSGSQPKAENGKAG